MDKAWKELKKWLTEAPILRHPNFAKPFILYTDASKKGVEAILAQHDDEAKADYVVEYFSRSLTQVQENWSATDLECLAIVKAVWHFNGYLKERPFTIYMDHQALATLRTQQNPKGRKARWIAELKNYDFKAKHWPGRDNSIADYLSQNPVLESINYIEDEQSYPKYVGVVTYDEDGIWMFTRLKSPMRGSLQVVFGKNDGEESQTAARREAREETGLELP